MSNFTGSNAYILESSDAANVIQDAAGNTGKTFRLHNNSNGAQVWSVSAGLGFTVGAVNSATLTIPAGSSVEVLSNGTRWVSTGGPARAIFAATGVTDAAGNFTAAIPAGLFAATPAAVATIQTVTANMTEARITALSTTSVTVNARQTAGINIALLGLTLLGLPVALPGATVHVIVTTQGATP